jgi:hypothetical protein
VCSFCLKELLVKRKIFGMQSLKHLLIKKKWKNFLKTRYKNLIYLIIVYRKKRWFQILTLEKLSMFPKRDLISNVR